jgi:hypothetical protein
VKSEGAVGEEALSFLEFSLSIGGSEKGQCLSVQTNYINASSAAYEQTQRKIFREG